MDDSTIIPDRAGFVVALRLRERGHLLGRTSGSARA